jgi:hypothetical protein
LTFGDLFRQLSLLAALPAALAAGFLAAVIVVVRDWRAVLLAYGLFSALISLLLAQVIPTEWALLQAITGGLVAVMLFLSARQLRVGPAPGADRALPAGLRRAIAWPRLASLPAFRLMALAVTVVVYLSVQDAITLPIVSPLFNDLILWLGLIGFLGLALHEEPLHAGLSLMVVIASAELLVFSLTQQRMVVGLAMAGQLILGLDISYLALSHGLALPPLREEDG